MDHVEKSQDATPVSDSTGFLAEYRSLQSEILSSQERRLQTITLTVGILGVILTVSGDAVMGTGTPTSEAKLVVAIGSGIAMYAILIPSLMMVTSLQQTIQRLGEYIRLFIEPCVPGLHWQQRWHDFRQQRQYPGGLRGLGELYYFLSPLPLLLPLYIVSQGAQNWFLIFILVPLIAWSLYLTYDLRAAKSKSWKWARWDDFKETPSIKKAG